MTQLEIKTTEEIKRTRMSGAGGIQMSYEEIKRTRMSGAGGIQMSYGRKKWVSVESLMKLIDERRDKGNVEGGGFSSALLLHEIIMELEK